MIRSGRVVVPFGPRAPASLRIGGTGARALGCVARGATGRSTPPRPFLRCEPERQDDWRSYPTIAPFRPTYWWLRHREDLVVNVLVVRVEWTRCSDNPLDGVVIDAEWSEPPYTLRTFLDLLATWTDVRWARVPQHPPIPNTRVL